MSSPVGRLLAVSVVAMIRPDPGQRPDRTAIDKRPVRGPVKVDSSGVAGDRQLDTRHHGGRDQAVYVFAREDVVHWESELGRPIAPGTFGENFTTTGIEVSDAVVGERWRVGADGPDAVLLEATLPRTPCGTFATWMGEPRWVRRFTAYGRVGSYARVIQPGTVQAGDEIETTVRPTHGVTIADVLRGLSTDQARRLRDAAETGEVELAPKLVKKVDSKLR
jgi:MOSC domain-containing protein YiiM